MSDNIKVAIRLRPLIPREKDKKAAVLWAVRDKKIITEVNSTSNEFCFDRVFSSDEDNEEVYTDLCLPIVDSVMKGFNGTIFAYGQTASGKTHTMMGEHNGITKGIIHFALQQIFDNIMDMPERQFLLRISFLEIYNEKVYDLLSEKNDDLRLQEDTYGNIKVNELQEKIVQTFEQILNYMLIGQNKRRTAETQMNRKSSRSHSIFRMIIESRVKDEEDAVVNVSQLNLVDLAGSEDVKRNESKGVRLREGININLSLLTLSKVINQLSLKDPHIAYRSSKLTRLLQNSLGGNALTAIICTVTPASSDKRETVSTLKFASRAKSIENKPEKNEILTDQAMLKKYADRIKKLSEELKASKVQGKELAEKTKQNEDLKLKIEALKACFVSQIAPATRNKAIRRETWGGHLDAKRLKAVGFAAPRKICPSYGDLSPLEEEHEGDSELTVLDADLTFKNRRSSCLSPKKIRFSSVLNMKNTGMQTEPEYNKDLNIAYDEAMLLVSELKSQLTSLQTEYAELNEYTTLEKQFLKAEDELLEETKVLKTENNFLREQLALFKSRENATKIEEKDSFKSKDAVLDSEQMESSCIQSLNNTLSLESSFNDSKQISERPMVNESGSTFLDETSKSQFLALYDDLESEVVAKLKGEIESLKYDNDLKDRQMGLLKDKVEIKEQLISSLNDEIILSKTSISATSKEENSTQTFDIDYELNTTNLQVCQADLEFRRYNKDKFTKECQTSPLHHIHTDYQNCDTFAKIETDVQMCQTDFEFGSPKKEKANKECQTISDVNSPQKSQSNKECNTSLLHLNHSAAVECDTNIKRETNVQFCQTDFELASPKKENLNKECQTSTYIKCGVCQRLNNSEQSEKDKKSSNFDSEAENCSRISPIKEYLTNIDTSIEEDKKFLENYRKCLEDGYSQTTPFKPKLFNARNLDNVLTDEKDIQTSPMKELRLLTERFKKDNNMNQCTQALVLDISKTKGDYSVFKVDQSTLTSPLVSKNMKINIGVSQQTNNISLQNQHDEIKILIKKISELKAYAFQFMKNSVKAKFIEGIDSSITYDEDNWVNLAEQEITSLEMLIKRIELCMSDMQEDSDLLNNRLELKFEEVISLDLKLSETEDALRRKEKEFSNLSEKIFKLKDSISQLTFLSSMIHNPEKNRIIDSEEKLEKLKKLADMHQNSEFSIPSHDVMLMQNMVSKLNSYMEENALQTINLAKKLKSVEHEFSTFKKETLKCQTYSENCSGFSKSTQTEFIGEMFKESCSSKSHEPEKQQIAQLESERKNLEEKVGKLEYITKNLEQELTNSKTQHSTQLYIAEVNLKTAESEWILKTNKLIKDLEKKYLKELAEQDDKQDAELLEFKKYHIKKEAELKEAFAKMRSLHDQELLDVKQTLQKEIEELSDRFYNEKLDLKNQLEKDKREVEYTLRKKIDDILAFYKRKITLYKDLDMQNKHYVEKINVLENEIEMMRGRIISYEKDDKADHLKDKIREVSSDQEKLLKKYNYAKQHIRKLEEDMEVMRAKSNNQPVLQSSSDSRENDKELDEIKRSLLNELDQKKAKITSLETNNAKMVKENIKLREMLSSKSSVPCKCKTYSKGSKTDFPPKCENAEKTERKIDSEVGQENLAANRAIGEEIKHQHNSNEESEQEKILCLGGGSGSANMVKNYWLEGMIHKKDKELARQQEEIIKLKAELKAMKSCPVIATTIKKEVIKKEPEVKMPTTAALENDENVTVYNAALHPYQQGVLPKVQPKYLLKDKNRRASGKPYDSLPQASHVKRPSSESELQPAVSKTKENRKEPLTHLEAAKMVVGESECKQQ